jgi:hypothetical protein
MARKGGNKKNCDAYKAAGTLQKNKARRIARDLALKAAAVAKKQA